MAELFYKIRFLSDWHCGSGLTAGSDVDLLVLKDKNELPFVPGKTLKGLFKEAVTIIGNFAKDKTEWDDFKKTIFGIQTNEDSNQSDEGSSYFSNAVLSEFLQNKLVSNPGLKSTLFRKIASTSIDENGLAKVHSLRKIEVTIPLELYGKISDIESKFTDKLIKCFKYTKRIGQNRNRGLGRCIISKWEVK